MISQRKIKSLEFTLQRFSFSVSLSFQVFETFRQFSRFGPSKYLSTLSRSSAGKSLKKSLNSKWGNFSCNLHRCSGPHDSKNTSTNLSKSFVESMRSSFSNLNEKIKTSCFLNATDNIMIRNNSKNIKIYNITSFNDLPWEIGFLSILHLTFDHVFYFIWKLMMELL